MPEPADYPNLSQLEAALRDLRPREDLDRPALWYRAGRASVRPSRIWPLAAGLSAALAAGLGLLLLTRPAERIVVYVPVPIPASPVLEAPPLQSEPPSPSSDEGTPVAGTTLETTDGLFASQSLRLTEQVLRWGLDGMPMPPEPAPSPPPETPASLLLAP